MKLDAKGRFMLRSTQYPSLPALGSVSRAGLSIALIHPASSALKYCSQLVSQGFTISPHTGVPKDTIYFVTPEYLSNSGASDVASPESRPVDP